MIKKMDRLDILKEIMGNLESMIKWSGSSYMKVARGVLDETALEDFKEIKDRTERISELIVKLDQFLAQVSRGNTQQIL